MFLLIGAESMVLGYKCPMGYARMLLRTPAPDHSTCTGILSQPDGGVDQAALKSRHTQMDRLLSKGDTVRWARQWLLDTGLLEYLQVAFEVEATDIRGQGTLYQRLGVVLLSCSLNFKAAQIRWGAKGG